MKILLIITDYGSFNNFLSELAVKLVYSGHEVHVICSPTKVINIKDKYPYKRLGIQFHYIEFPRSFNLYKQLIASRAISKKIKKLDPYLINIHFTTGIFTTLLWKKPSTFTIGTVHGVGYPMIKSRVKRLIFQIVEKFCFMKLDQIYLINEFDYNLVKELYPYKTFRYSSFGVGNDLQRFDPGALDLEVKERLRRKLSIKESDFVLVFTGRFVDFKGFDVVIRAVRSLLRTCDDIKLIVIGGEDPAHGTGLTQEEQYFYRSHPHISRVGFTPDVNMYLSISDLFVFPSQKEGMPVCIMEALAMGVPVVTSNSRGCKDLISHYFNGLVLSEHPTVEETTNAILQLYNNRLLLRKLSENALSERKLFSRENFVENQIRIYSNLEETVKYQSAS